jgi:hypothetical protein
MRKLKLESLQVESFATTGLNNPWRGTVEGHAQIPGPDTGPSYCGVCYATQDVRTCEPLTYDVNQCGETQYMDCTFGCTRHNSCNKCWIEDTKKCAID